MADSVNPGAHKSRWELAVEEVDQWLTGTFSGIAHLDQRQLGRYPNREPRAGWRVLVDFGNNKRQFDILVGAEFPFDPPRFALVDPPAFPTWPHLETDGCLCLLPGAATSNVDDPISVVKNLLKMAVEWFEASEDGSNADDFRSEFKSYWMVEPTAPHVWSMLDPAGPSRAIAAIRLKGHFVVADDESRLKSWRRRLGADQQSAEQKALSALLIWLPRPLLPNEYPCSAAEVGELIATARLDPAFDSADADKLEKLVILAAPTENGPCMAAVVLQRTAPNLKNGGSGRSFGGVERGFRPGRVPKEILTKRVLGSSRSLKTSVERVDPSWIHGRDASTELPQLLGAKIVLIGCGSLGGPVALALAQIGVGSLDLIDPEKLVPANVGRHPLGVSEIGQFKALALSHRIGSGYPHIQHVEGHVRRWEELAESGQELFDDADVIISTVGSWSSEAALNAWRHDRHNNSSMLFGWTEPHAVAGHAVGLVGVRGCLACGLSSVGEPHLRVSDWPIGTGLRNEPACGVTFQPYGPVAAAHIIAMITEAAVDIVLRRELSSFHRIWVARAAVLERAGGAWSENWLAAGGGGEVGGRIVDRIWPSRTDCSICTGGIR